MSIPNPTAGQTREENLQAGLVRFEHDIGSQPLSWYAGVGHTERMPDYRELSSADRGPAGSVNTFAGIETEKTTRIDVGLQYRGKRADAWVSACAGRIDDYILFDYLRGGMMGTSTRVGNVGADIRWGELGVEHRPDPQCRLGVDCRPDPQGKLGVDCRPDPQGKLGATLAYARGDNRDAGRAAADAAAGGAVDGRMGPRSLVDGRTDTGTGSTGPGRAGPGQRRARARAAPGQGSVIGQDLDASPGLATSAINGGYRCNPIMQLAVGVETCSTAATASTSSSRATPISVVRPFRCASTNRAAMPGSS